MLTIERDPDHEHASHPHYRGVIKAEYIGPASVWQWATGGGDVPMTAEEIARFRVERHALIYCDGTIAVTLFEYVYAVWHVESGAVRSGELWKKGEWRLTEESRATLAAAGLWPVAAPGGAATALRGELMASGQTEAIDALDRLAKDGEC